MNSLDLDRQEAEKVYESDCAIDKGLKQDFDLTGEKLAIARSYIKQGIKKKKGEGTTVEKASAAATTTTTTKKPFVPNLPQKEKKKDNEKISFVSMLADFLNDKVEDLEIVNPSQKISFSMGSSDFSLTLTRHGNKTKKKEG